jgi:hypothetical protein
LERAAKQEKIGTQRKFGWLRSSTVDVYPIRMRLDEDFRRKIDNPKRAIFSRLLPPITAED